MIYSLTLFSSQGKLRLQKWYISLSDKLKRKITREMMQLILPRKNKLSNFLEYKQYKIVYKKYASLFFSCLVSEDDNELLVLEVIHRYVELLDKYFGNVCELDIVFNFEKAHHILDEYMLGGEVQESSMKTVVSAIHQMDLIQEEQEEPPGILEELGF